MKKSKLFQQWGTFRKGQDAQSIQLSFASHLEYSLGKDEHTATALDRYLALALAVRDRLMRRWIQTQQTYYTEDVKRVYYLSLEFLMGRALENNLINLGIYDGISRRPCTSLGLDLDDLAGRRSRTPGLGNGGLGRLAACFLDSMATLEHPGLRLRHPLRVRHLRPGDPRRLARWSGPTTGCASATPGRSPAPRTSSPVHFDGRTEHDRRARRRAARCAGSTPSDVLGMPYDIAHRRLRQRHRQHPAAVAGPGLQRVRPGRLQRRRLPDGGRGEERLREHLQGALPERRAHRMGKELRLQQQYFFVSCSLHDIVRPLPEDPPRRSTSFPDKVAIQLNDTHPAIAIAELMRMLLDEHGLDWDKAWDI